MIALESAAGTAAAYYHWNENQIRRQSRQTQILSDGILRQKGFSLQFESDNGRSVIPSESTDIINIYSNVVLDTGFSSSGSPGS